MLDFRVDTFLKVCQCMNYTKAAEELHMTQPAISQQIRYLEEVYQTKLFLYENRKLILTEDGQKLRQAFQTMVHDEIKLKEKIGLKAGRKHYRIGASMSIGEYDLPHSLSDYLKNNPDLSVSITVADTKALLAMLDKGELDIALSEGYFYKEEYEYKFIRNEKLYLYAGVNYPIKQNISLEQLMEHPILAREKGSGTREVFERFLTEKGYQIESFSKCSDFTSPRLLTQMLLANLGVSVLYDCVGKELVKENRLQIVKVKGMDLSHDFHAIWQKGSLFGSEYQTLLDGLKL